MDFIETSNTQSVSPASQKKLSKTATTLIALTGGIGIGLTVVCASFVAPAFRKYCLPYVPATDQQIKNVLSVIPKNIQGKLLDIGSGDGRIFDIKSYDYIVIFGVEQMMNDLEHKLIAEAKGNSKVIACRFPLPNSEPIKVIGDGVDTVWLYDLENSNKSKILELVKVLILQGSFRKTFKIQKSL
uniref:Methyltransferase domain-containing protein n=1 Tax=Megaselia scalaris TaxID=36166 RepID=T1GR97_MEGSC